ncbi:MAG TPA: hypothetical protein GX404_03885 [Syntrophomonadaceae bacterium]|nr:hypothetical protein [Syntrophomonadaceae bacterium]
MMELDVQKWRQRLEEVELLYTKLLNISCQQKDLMAAFDPDTQGQVEQLDALLQEREGLMQRIDMVSISQEEEINLLKILEQEGHTERWRLARQMQQDYQKSRQELQSVLQTIQENDQKTQDKMAEAIKELGSRLANARENVRATRAYTRYGTSSEGWFIDQKK